MLFAKFTGQPADDTIFGATATAAACPQSSAFQRR